MLMKKVLVHRALLNPSLKISCLVIWNRHLTSTKSKSQSSNLLSLEQETDMNSSNTKALRRVMGNKLVKLS